MYVCVCVHVCVHVCVCACVHVCTEPIDERNASSCRLDEAVSRSLATSRLATPLFAR